MIISHNLAKLRMVLFCARTVIVGRSHACGTRGIPPGAQSPPSFQEDPLKGACDDERSTARCLLRARALVLAVGIGRNV